MLRSRQISICLLLCIIMAYLSSNLTAQISKDKASNPRNALRKGSLSLDFRITDQFTLTSFRGSMISCKYQYSDKSALRWGLTLSGFHDVMESQPRDTKTAQDIYLVKISIQYMHYLSIDKLVCPYFAVGPAVTYRHYKFNESPQTSSLNFNRNQRKIYAGIQANWGVEWFISGDISLVAEYGVTLALYGQDAYRWTYEPVHTEFSLKSNPVNFGVSVYF